MKRLPYIPTALLGLLFAVSCIEEDLNPCPPEGGGVAITLRVEKFRALPPYAPGELEENFAERIHTLDYLLYSDEKLIERGRLDDVQQAVGGSYVFRHDALPFGHYRVAFVANASARMMTGKIDAPESYYIIYLGEGDGDDHFRADLPFEVTCPCRNEFDTVLMRVHGVTRFRFENVPADIKSIEVSLDNVGERMPLCGDPDRGCEVVKRILTTSLVSRTAGSCLLGTFCTLPGTRSSWRLKLYAEEGAEPVYDRLVTDTIRIECNQLVDLTARFKGSEFTGDIEFAVDIDTSWDGSNEGGGGEITISKLDGPAR